MRRPALGIGPDASPEEAEEARKASIQKWRADAAEFLAHSLYYGCPADRDRAGQYAEEAAALGASRELARDISRQIAQDKQDEQRELEQQKRRAEAEEERRRRYAREQAAREARSKRIAQAGESARKRYVAAQVCLVLCWILAVCPHISGEGRFLYSVVWMLLFYIAAAFVKFYHTLHGLLENEEFFWSGYVCIWFLPINGVNLELGLVGFSFLFLMFGVLYDVLSDPSGLVYTFLLLICLFILMIFISGKCAERAAGRLKQ